MEANGVDLRAGRETLRAGACVLACGIAYGFQRQLGLGLPGQVAHTAQLEMDAAPAETVDLHFGREIAPDGFIWIVPLTRDGRSRVKIGVLARGDAGGYLERFLTHPEVRARLRAEPGSPVRRLRPLRQIAKTYGDRLQVVGEVFDSRTW